MYCVFKLLKGTLTLKPFNVSYCTYSSTTLCLIINHCNILNSSSSVTLRLFPCMSVVGPVCVELLLSAPSASISLRQLHRAAVFTAAGSGETRTAVCTADGKLEHQCATQSTARSRKEERNSPDSIRKSFNLVSC